MNEKLEFFRRIDRIIIPSQFTYLNHCTSYISSDLKQRAKNGRYIHNWQILPFDEFVIKREMSFGERDSRIKEVLSYRKPLSETDILYQLPDYSKPFIIRVILPKREKLRDGEIKISDDHKKQLEKIYIGGDYRHPKIFNNDKIYIIGYSLEDEVSKKRVDIFYGVRESDIDIYYEYVVRAITKDGYLINSDVNLAIKDEYGLPCNYYPHSYCIMKTADRSRYIPNETGKSPFELELLEDYKENIECQEGELLPIKNKFDYYRLYNDYPKDTRFYK